MKIQTVLRTRGFTLIEMVTCVAIMAILCTISAPALGGLIQSEQSRAAKTAMLNALYAARVAAVARDTEIAVCASHDQQFCDGEMTWQDGWIVFEDKNHDGKRDVSEPILQAATTQKGMFIITSVDRLHVTFRPDGSSPGTNATFTFCDKQGSRASTVVVNNAGRPREGSASPAQAAACANATRT